MATIEYAVDTDEESPSKTFHTLANDPILWITIPTRTAILLGIVFLKIAKPNLGGSLLIIVIAIIIGVASALPVLHHQQVRAGSVARIIRAFIVPASVAALVLLAANSIPPSTIPFSITKSDLWSVQTNRPEVPTSVMTSSLSMSAPTLFPKTVLQEGQLLLQTQCTQCHPLQKILQGKKTRTEWENTLSKMESFNVNISDTEKKVLLDYLTTVDSP